MRLSMSRIAVSTAAAIVLSGLVAAPAIAASGVSTWTGLGTDNNWTTAGNWDTVPAAGSDLVFPDISNAARHTAVNDFATGTSFGSITIAEPGYTLSGNGFAPTGGLQADYGTGTSTINSAVAGPGTVSVHSGGTLTLGGSLSGSSGLTKTGAGIAVLTTANNYTGVTNVDAGTLAIANSSALGSWAVGDGTSVADGATLEIRGTINTSEPIRIVGSGADDVGSLYNSAGNNVVQHVVMTGDAEIGAASDTFLLIPSSLGESAGSARMTKTGAGVLDVLAGATYTGQTDVTAGTLAVEGTVAGTINVAAGATLSGAGGNVEHIVSVGGTVTAGFRTSPFTSDTETLLLDSDSTFVAQLSGTQAGNGSTGHSRLIVAQGATLGGATLTATMNGYTPAIGDALTILTTKYGVTGTFKGLPEGGIFTTGGKAFRISYQGGDGNDVVLTNVDATAPNTVISLGPTGGSATTATDATFTFSSADADLASFECSFDASPFTACTSPMTYTGLDVGSHTVAVRAVDTSGNVDPTPATRTWTVTGVFESTGSVVVNGSAKVGQTLTASSTVTTDPVATSTTGQWFRGSSPIDGATGSRYELTGADLSFEISYRETRTRANYETAVAMSEPTASVTGGIITLDVPTISGNAVVDQVLTATPGTVDPASATVELSWSVDGVPAGSGSTYTVKPGDVGKPVTVTAEATKTDYDTVAKTSAPTGAVTEATFTSGPTASITGAFKVGEELTAGEGAPSPAPTSYTYQWFAGSDKIDGATSRTFTLTKAQKDLTITVEVTAVRAGYTDASDTSAASAVVVTNEAPDLSFAPTSKKLRLGKATTLSWSSQDAISLEASGGWSGTKSSSGSETVKPARVGTQVYKLTAINGSGTTTAQVSVEVALPAAKLTLKARKSVKAGAKLTVSTSGLAPREAYTVRIGGKKLASGKASATGKVKRTVRVPASTKAGKRLIRVTGSIADRTGTRRVTVTKTKAPKVTLRDSSVRASDDQRVTVRNLRPHEKVKVTYKGERISPKSARANAKGVYKLTFDVGIYWGRKTVTVKGAQSGKSTSEQFSVVNRCPQGGYYCR